MELQEILQNQPDSVRRSVPEPSLVLDRKFIARAALKRLSIRSTEHSTYSEESFADAEIVLFSDLAVFRDSDKNVVLVADLSWNSEAHFAYICEEENENGENSKFRLVQVRAEERQMPEDQFKPNKFTGADYLISILSRFDCAKIKEKVISVQFNTHSDALKWINAIQDVLFKAFSAKTKINISRGLNLKSSFWRHFLHRGTFHSACLIGNFDIVSRSLEIKPQLVKGIDEDGFYPIHLAAYGGNAEILELLLENSADLEARDPVGKSALHIALFRNDPEVVRVLCDKIEERHFSLQDNEGKVPLFEIINPSANDSKAGRECLEMILEAGADPDVRIPIMENPENSNSNSKKRSRSKGSMRNSKGSRRSRRSFSRSVRSRKSESRILSGNGALHICARNDLRNLTQLLLIGGADPSLPTLTMRQSPIVFALENGHLELAKILLQFGAQPNIKDKVGSCPLHFAKSVESARLLVSYGARLEFANDMFANPADIRVLRFAQKRFTERTYGNLIEGDHMVAQSEWLDDQCSDVCLLCSMKFSFLRRKHHCRRCGTLVCHDCSSHHFLFGDLSAISTMTISEKQKLRNTRLADVPSRKSSLSYISTEEKSSEMTPHRCCDGCFNFLLYSSSYDFQSIIDGDTLPTRRLAMSIGINDQASDSTVDPSSLSNEVIPKIDVTCTEDIPCNSSGYQELQPSASEKGETSELSNQFQQMRLESEDLKTALEAAEAKRETAEKKVQELESQMTKMETLLEEANKEREEDFQRFSDSFQFLEHDLQKKDIAIIGLLEEIEQLQTQITRISALGSHESGESHDSKTLELQSRVIELKKELSESQRREEEASRMTIEARSAELDKNKSIRGAYRAKKLVGMASLPKKSISEFEHRIADLEFQLLYGQTKKDQSIARLQKRIKKLEQENDELRMSFDSELSDLKQKLKDHKEQSLESWIFDSQDLVTL